MRHLRYRLIDDPDLLAAMMDALVHRGPDGQGTFRQRPFALGHRRLSITTTWSGACTTRAPPPSSRG
ncbi:MAG: hypothetical protein AB1816_15810 [Bacillota bacterium]